MSMYCRICGKTIEEDDLDHCSDCEVLEEPDVHYQRGYKQGFDRGRSEERQKIANIVGKLKGEADEARNAADCTSYSESDCLGTEATVLDRVISELLAI